MAQPESRLTAAYQEEQRPDPGPAGIIRRVVIEGYISSSTDDFGEEVLLFVVA